MADTRTLILRSAVEGDIPELMNWFGSKSELDIWAGPGISFPFDRQSFSEGLKLFELNSYVLSDHNGAFLGFGQFYLRLARCHLGRLVINPKHRGQGLSQILISKLIEKGSTVLNTKSVSLFVLDHNVVAINSYSKLGFEFQSYPEALPLDNCSYMVKSL